LPRADNPRQLEMQHELDQLDQEWARRRPSYDMPSDGAVIGFLLAGILGLIIAAVVIFWAGSLDGSFNWGLCWAWVCVAPIIGISVLPMLGKAWWYKHTYKVYQARRAAIYARYNEPS
jgi:hypothetical protein